MFNESNIKLIIILKKQLGVVHRKKCVSDYSFEPACSAMVVKKKYILLFYKITP